MQLGPLGFPELLLLFVVLLIVFGPRRLPEIGRQIGKAMAELRKSTREMQRALEEEVSPRDLDGKSLVGDLRQDIEGLGEEVRKAADGASLTYYDAAPPPYGSGPAPPPPGSGSDPASPSPAEEAKPESGPGKAESAPGSGPGKDAGGKS